MKTYASTADIAAQVQGYASAPNRAETAPLTNEVMTSVQLAIDSASRAHGVLYELRNRLFGYPPPSQGSDMAKPSPDCFSDVYRDRARELSFMLESVESLSRELADRL